MVKISNILFEGDKISCSYFPENSCYIGKITVDAVTRDVINVQFSKYEYGKKMYAAQVRQKLCELLDNGQPIPEETAAVWY